LEQNTVHFLQLLKAPPHGDGFNWLRHIQWNHEAQSHNQAFGSESEMLKTLSF
jgi:hypothetical protein